MLTGEEFVLYIQAEKHKYSYQETREITTNQYSISAKQLKEHRMVFFSHSLINTFIKSEQSEQIVNNEKENSSQICLFAVNTSEQTSA